MIDLSTNFEQQGYSVYLPALSTFYVRQVSKLKQDPNYYGEGRLPESLDRGYEGFDFLGQHAPYHYRWALYSAGHAHLDVASAKQKEHMIHERDRSRTTLIGDSSGFQVAKGTGHFKNVDWNDFAGPGGDQIRAAILEWLESTADWSMTFDVPALSAEPPFNAKTGLSSFQDTLDYTLLNLEYFVQNRTPGRTRFLNVLSGSTSVNSRTWYDAVTPYSDPQWVAQQGHSAQCAMEGYAFAGINRMHMKTALQRVVDLARDGLLENKDWIHFLGIGRLDWACYLTAIQRRLRQHYNPNITISFDAASPFVAAAKGLIYTHNIFTPRRWGYNMNHCVDDRNLKNSTLPMPYGSPITEHLTVGDICRLGPGEANAQGKVGNTSWDTMSYLLIMAHSVYNHIYSVQEANRLVDCEIATLSPQLRHHSNWTKTKRTSAENQISEVVPSDLLYFDSLMEELLDPACADPYALLDQHTAFLDSISFGGRGTGVFQELFDQPAESPEDLCVDADDEDLQKLEDHC